MFEIEKLSKSNQLVRIVRDDTIRDYYGGNKARKIQFIEKKIKDKSCNAIVTTGGIQSNHCRVTALMAAKNGWSCLLVLHGNKTRFENENGNAAIIRAINPQVIFVEASGISDAMDKGMTDFKQHGLNPFYLTGGGHTVEGVISYIEAIKELKEYCQAKNWYPDHIVLPSGTGSTQAGLIAGLKVHDLQHIQVTGISIARKQKHGVENILRLLNELNESQGYDYDYSDSIHFNDQFLIGGYEQSNSELDAFVDLVNQQSGIIFDTTYSGKALFGMSKLEEQGKLKGNILFWHTGGIFNYLAKQ